ncbi:MAG TPA: hypothetical protein DGJ56_03545 [Verrucomicrobiales bacterium]|nr:hypothetical protein [Verrucomicrobiales bacterium]
MTRQLKAIAVGCALVMTGGAVVRAVVDTEALPDVEEGFEIEFFVKEPHIINPSALFFDKHGGGEKPGAMYQIYLTKADLKKTNLVDSVKAMDKADPAHGREIFFGRGTCYACHKAAGQGITLGPDLNGIRTRRDVEYVICSILIPDEYIVECFQQTSLAMKDGRKLFGMIQEETAETVKIYLPTGEQVVVRAADILKRDDAKNSGMPSSFIYSLSDKDVADLTAWIMSLQ